MNIKVELKPLNFEETQSIRDKQFYFSENDLPTEIVAYIFSFLSFEDLAQACLVSRAWKQITSDLSNKALKIFSSCFFFKDWEKHLQFNVPPRFHSFSYNFIFSILTSACPFHPEKKIWETHTLLEIPKNLTLKKICHLPSTTEWGNQKWIQYIWPEYLNSSSPSWTTKSEDFEDKPVSETHYVLIKNEVLEGSREQSFEYQQALISNYKGYEVPSLITGIVANIAKFIKSKEQHIHLYGTNPFTYTRCQEKYKQSPYIVGAFSVEGLIVSPDSLGKDESIGIAPMRKLS